MNWWRMETSSGALVEKGLKYFCKHSIAMSIKFKGLEILDIAKSVPLTENRNRGCPNNNKGWGSHLKVIINCVILFVKSLILILLYSTMTFCTVHVLFDN